MKIGRLAVIVFTLLILGFLIYFFRQIVSYVLIAWVISMVGAPLMDLLLEKAQFKRWKFGSALAAMLVLLVFMVVVVTIFMVFVPLVVEQARNFGSVDYQAVGQALSEPLNSLNQTLYSWGFIEEIESPSEQIKNLTSQWLKPTIVGDIFGSIVGFAGNLVISIFSILFIAFFFLKESGLFVSFVKAMVPNEYEDRVVTAIDEMSNLLTRYFGGIFIQMSIITIFISVTLSILGIKNAILIGFFAAIVNLIPYVGPILGATFGVIVTISANLDLEFYTQMLPKLIQVVAVFGAMQLIDNFLLQPYIFSNSVKAHPLEIFVVILMGAQVGGILGMVLAIPGYTAVRVIAKVFLSEFKVVQKITQGMES